MSVINSIKITPLFKGIDEKEIEILIRKLGSWQRSYKKGEYIYLAGDYVKAMGIILSGEAYIVSYDDEGRKNIVAYIQSGGFFGEVYAMLPNQPILVDVEAGEDTKVLFIDTKCIFSSKKTVSESKFTQNLMQIMAQKNMTLSRKILYTSVKTMRGRIMMYLSEQQILEKSNSFTIPFNRQEMADFLAVNRSALSKELSAMKKDGLIEYNKNKFTILVDWRN